MKLNFFKKWVIITKSVWLTFIMTVATIVDIYRGKFTRERGNKILRKWSKKLLDYINLSHKVINPHQTEYPEERPCIIMSNHASAYDIPLIFVGLPGSIRMLTKKELFRVPIWGLGMRLGEFVAVTRNNSEKAIKDLQVARRKMESGIVLWVSPEGTRSMSGVDLGRFKKGGFMLALETQAVIIPVGIRGSHRALPAKTLDIRLNQEVEIHVGEAIDTANYTLEQRDQLMSDTRKAMLALCDFEESEKSENLDTSSSVGVPANSTVSENTSVSERI